MEIQKILDKLQDFDLSEISIAPGPTHIHTHKMIKPGQARFFPACLYVGYVSELPPALEDGGQANLICIQDCDLPSGLTHSGDVNLYLTPPGTNQFDILNRVADILIDEATVTAAMRRILDSLYIGEGLQGLVDVACEVFENPLFINDPAYKIIAMSHNTVFKDKNLEEEKELGYIHPENVTAMRRASLIETGSRREGGLYYSRRPEKNESWIIADVQLHGITVGTVALVDNNRPFRELDWELLERFRKILAVEMEKNDFYQNNRGVMYNYFLGDLLSGKIQDNKTIFQRAHILNWKMYQWFQMMVIVDNGKDHSELRLQPIADNIRRFIPDCRWTIHQHNLVVFLSRPNKEILTQTEQERLEQFFTDNSLYAGLSLPFEDLMDASKRYQQAMRSVDIGVYIKRSGHIYHYEDMIIYYAARLALRHNNLRDFCPEEVSVLEAYDKETGSELLKTLDRFLLYVDDPVTAANSLNIHRNTLLYRINKIKKLTGLDLKNGNQRLRIQFYLKLAEYQRGGWRDSGAFP